MNEPQSAPPPPSEPVVRMNGVAGAVVLLLAAAHVICASIAARQSSGPRVLEVGLLRGAILLIVGSVIAAALAALTRRAFPGRARLATAVFCSTLIGTQVYALRNAWKTPDPAAARQVVEQALQPPAPASAATSVPAQGAAAFDDAGIIDLNHVLSVLDAAVSVAGGDERVMIAATRTAIAPLAPLQERHAASYKALRAAGGIDLSSLRTRDDVQQRLDLVEGLQRSGELLESALRGLPEAIEHELETRFRFEDVQRFVAEFSEAAQLDRQLRLRSAEAGFCKESRRLLTMLWRAWGRWQVPGDGLRRPVFDDDELEADFDRVLKRVLAYVVEQSRVQAELDAFTPR